MSEQLPASWLRDRVLAFLEEGEDAEAAAWLRECPLLDGKASRGFGNDLEVELEFGCNRANMRAFEDEDQVIAGALYEALAAVTMPHRIRYSIVLRYLTSDAVTREHEDVVLELPEKTLDDPPPF